MAKIIIESHILESMKKHAKELHPIECCGYLGAQDGVVNTIYKMKNIDNSPEHFSFDPKEQFQVVKDARKNNIDLVSVYHSHPETPARLSEEDIKLLNDPSMIYSIVSLMENQPDIKAYQLSKTDDEVTINRVEIDSIIKK